MVASLNDDDVLHPSTAELDMEGHCMEAGGHCLVGTTICCTRLQVFVRRQVCDSAYRDLGSSSTDAPLASTDCRYSAQDCSDAGPRRATY